MSMMIEHLKITFWKNYAIFQNFAFVRAHRYHRREKRPLQSMSDLNESFWDGLGAEIDAARPEIQGATHRSRLGPIDSK